MKVYSKPIEFQWDVGNKTKNWAKHKVKIEEAEEIFNNEPNLVFPDTKHSNKEVRYGIFGITNEGRLLAAVFTIRSKKVRVTTIRDMSKREQKVFNKLLREVQK